MKSFLCCYDEVPSKDDASSYQSYGEKGRKDTDAPRETSLGTISLTQLWGSALIDLVDPRRYSSLTKPLLCCWLC